uniref:Uncharacterized protein n=1 Tax=Meloidogyne enterolobii TaxID=390850 RepID=A0A6V7UR83_MELEN|nr:unnamed protein product [Meloidogyne enterolobii]
MSHWMVDQPWASGVYNSNYMPVIDMQMRKKLPYWILEGLEKAEKEKKKKQEKEELEKRKKEEEEEKRKKRDEKGLGKFDSDSEEEDGSSNGEVKKKNGKNSPVIPEKCQFREFVQEEIEDTRTEEELKVEAIALMRSLITSVLLSVTNREIERIAEEQLTKEKNKAQPKLLAKSSALAALTSLFDDEGDDESSTDGEDSSPNKNICKNVEQIGQPSIDEGANKAEENSVVFKVPLAPQPRSAAKSELSQDEKLEKLKKFIENKNEESKDERKKEIKRSLIRHPRKMSSVCLPAILQIKKRSEARNQIVITEEGAAGKENLLLPVEGVIEARNAKGKEVENGVIKGILVVKIKKEEVEGRNMKGIEIRRVQEDVQRVEVLEKRDTKVRITIVPQDVEFFFVW